MWLAPPTSARRGPARVEGRGVRAGRQALCWSSGGEISGSELCSRQTREAERRAVGRGTVLDREGARSPARAGWEPSQDCGLWARCSALSHGKGSVTHPGSDKDQAEDTVRGI